MIDTPLHAGKLVKHDRTGAGYMVYSARPVEMRVASGEWVKAVQYVRTLELTGPIFVRDEESFRQNFSEVKP